MQRHHAPVGLAVKSSPASAASGHKRKAATGAAAQSRAGKLHSAHIGATIDGNPVSGLPEATSFEQPRSYVLSSDVYFWNDFRLLQQPEYRVHLIGQGACRAT